MKLFAFLTVLVLAAPAFAGPPETAVLKAKNGDAYGQRIYDSAKEGTITEVTYLFPRPGSTEPVQKTSYVTKVGDQVCGVGYYQ